MLKKILLTTVVVLAVSLSQSSSVRGAPGIEIYANGGSYWTQTGSNWNYHSNAGWCYLYGGSWCQPKHFQWVYNVNYSPPSNTGKWDNVDYDYTYGTVSIFVPSSDATAYATYLVTYNVAGQYWCDVNQAIHYNQWILCYTGSGWPELLGIRNVYLNNYSPYGSPGTTKIAFGEIKIEY
jgi:hypothetical protein